MKRFWKWLCKTKTRTVISFFCFVVLLTFTAVVLLISNNGGVVPPELIICVFSTFATPIVLSALITLKELSIKRIKVGELEVEMGGNDENI